MHHRREDRSNGLDDAETREDFRDDRNGHSDLHEHPINLQCFLHLPGDDVHDLHCRAPF